MIEASERYAPAANVVARDIPEGLMLVDLQSGEAFKLNAVGSTVWRQLDGVRDVAAIVIGLEARYPVPVETLRRDLEALLIDLSSRGLIQRTPPGV